MRTIGLTGGIGSGKSTATQILGACGAITIDADPIGHEVYQPGTEGWSCVVEAFGNQILSGDGTINRKALSAKVFSDPRDLEQLNRIVHPRIGKIIRARISEAASTTPTPPAIVVEAALLLEAGWNSFVDEVWVIVAPHETRIERAISTRPMTREDVERRIASQIHDDERCRLADVVIPNAGSHDDLREHLVKIWNQRIQPSPQNGGDSV